MVILGVCASVNKQAASLIQKIIAIYEMSTTTQTVHLICATENVYNIMLCSFCLDLNLSELIFFSDLSPFNTNV